MSINRSPSIQSDEMMNFLYSLAKVHRITEKKRQVVAKMTKMNDIVESSGEDRITVEFKNIYAKLILHLYDLNQQFKQHIDVVMLRTAEIADGYGMADVSYWSDRHRLCEDEAFDVVYNLKSCEVPEMIDNSKLILISKLTSILTCLARSHDNCGTNSGLSGIEDILADIRHRLHPSNLRCFEQSVEQLISQIMPMTTVNVTFTKQ